jgi:hypothetical protein
MVNVPTSGLPALTLRGKVTAMEQNAAAEHLQVIRTLMERSALYRRALAPIMLYVGTLGALTCAGGIVFRIEATRWFCGLWLGTALLAVAGAFLIARRQSLKDHEPFWSPPTRRVTQAIVPPLASGLFFSALFLVVDDEELLPLFVFLNVSFYGCALHAAGFFMPRGVRRFGWLMLAFGGALLALLVILAFGEADFSAWLNHALMGFFFGALHLAYGAYLYVTEKRKTAA